MRILIISDSYPPEIRSASHLVEEMAVELKNRGHHVYVATTYPQYNMAEESKEYVFDEYSVECDVNLIRIKVIPHHNVNFIIRGISQLTMPFIFLYKINKYIKEYIDVIIVYSPPLPLAIVGKKIKEKMKSRFILNVQDIFPKNAVDLGILKSRIIISFFRFLESRSYREADKIVVHSKGNADFLNKNRNIPYDKIKVIYNWIDAFQFRNVKNKHIYRKRLGIEDKFVILFAGVIGPSQGLEAIIEVAKETKDIDDLLFLIVGEGTEKENLVDLVRKYRLSNIKFYPFVSKESYYHLLKEVDVGLVCLSSNNKTPVVPGKILGYMAASIPIIAFLNKESDAHLIIEEAKCGYSTNSNDLKKMVNIVKSIVKNRNSLKQLGRSGYYYLLRHFEKKLCIDKLEENFL